MSSWGTQDQCDVEKYLGVFSHPVPSITTYRNGIDGKLALPVPEAVLDEGEVA